MNNPRKSAAEKKRIGIIVLAAGASSRMGEPKQFLEFQGRTLLRRAVETAVASVAVSVTAILGANYERARSEIEDLPIEIVFNDDWASGLASSIKSGVKNLLDEKNYRGHNYQAPRVSAALIMLADQPFVAVNHLNLLSEKYLAKSDNLIVAAEYNRTVGVPAIFSCAVFDDLRRLAGDEGAKKVIKKYGSLVKTVSLPEAAFDIDTPSDLGFLNSDFGS